jgi:hypothetical protein
VKATLVRAPLVIGSSISGALVLLALVEALGSGPRWDDHLLNATGVLGGALLVSLTLWLVTAVFRPDPNVTQRVRRTRIAALIALVLLTLVAISVAVFINDMSFL